MSGKGPALDSPMVHAVMVKWKCSVCGGFESNTGKFSYDYEPLRLKEESMLQASDITGHGAPINLCPKCIYKAAVLIKDMLTIGEEGGELAWMVKVKPEERLEEKKGWLKKK